MSLSTVSTPWRSLLSMTRVLSTSRGVVMPAATAPLAEPYSALSAALTSIVGAGDDEEERVPDTEEGRAAWCSSSLRWRDQDLRASHSGNWITVKGTSRMTVMPQP